MPETKEEATTKSVDLTECKIFHGITYGPGEGIEVPSDFPDQDTPRPLTMANLGKHVGPGGAVEAITRQGKINPMAGARPGTSGSGVSLEHAPGEEVVNEGAPADDKRGKQVEKAADKQMSENASAAKDKTKEMKAAGQTVEKPEGPGVGGAATIPTKAAK